MNPVTAKEPYTAERKRQQGVIYVAFGLPYLIMATHSMKTLRETNPELPVCIVSNIDLNADEIPFWRKDSDQWRVIHQPDSANRNYKLSIDKLTPFQQTLYLDCDTEVWDDVEPFFFLLENFDFVITPTPGAGAQPRLGKVLFGGERGLSNTPYWSSGVFAFRSNESTVTLFEDWRALFERMALGVDQPGLAESLISGRLRFAGVDRQWNWSAQQWQLRRIPGWPIRILHYMYLVDSRIANRLLHTAAMVDDIRGADGEVERYMKSYIAKRRRTRLKKLLRELGNRDYVGMIVDELKYRSTGLGRMLRLKGRGS